MLGNAFAAAATAQNYKPNSNNSTREKKPTAPRRKRGGGKPNAEEQLHSVNEETELSMDEACGTASKDHSSTRNDDISQMTDEDGGFHTLGGQPVPIMTFRRTFRCRSDGTSSSGSGSSLSEKETALVVTEKDDTMRDLVVRLQLLAKKQESEVLRFPKKDINAIRAGIKQIEFNVPQIKAKFSKQEFGAMKATQLLQMTSSRPLIVYICC